MTAARASARRSANSGVVGFCRIGCRLRWLLPKPVRVAGKLRWPIAPARFRSRCRHPGSAQSTRMTTFNIATITSATVVTITCSFVPIREPARVRFAYWRVMHGPAGPAPPRRGTRKRPAGCGRPAGEQRQRSRRLMRAAITAEPSAAALLPDYYLAGGSWRGGTAGGRAPAGSAAARVWPWPACRA